MQGDDCSLLHIHGEPLELSKFDGLSMDMATDRDTHVTFHSTFMVYMPT